jgi:hypothetical protein
MALMKPVMPKGITNVARVYLASSRSFAVRDLSTVALAKVDGSLWIWGFGSTGDQGILGRNLRVPTLLELP